MNHLRLNKPTFKPSLLACLFIALIKLYKITLSPFIGWNCRFQPTCSSYALEAFQTHNVFYALYLMIKRLLSCHPFHAGGYDPVPEKNHTHKDSKIL